MKSSTYRCSLVCALATLCCMLGCSANLTMPDSPTSTAATITGGSGTLKGSVYGGRQPITGASIYLYAASNSGYAAAGTSLLGNLNGQCAAAPSAPSTPVTGTLYKDASDNCYVVTDSSGAFELSGLYSCTSGQQVWIYSIGGNPGVVSGTQGTNVQAGLTASLGACGAAGNFSSDNFIYVNEVSTVAFAYSVAGFASDATHVGAPGTNTAGLANAFANAAQLYDIFGGSDPGGRGARHMTPNANGTNLPSEGNGTDPYYLINSLANVIASCINSANPTPDSSSQCSDLFSNVYGSGNVPSPSDTASIMIFIAQNPAPPNLGISASNLLNIETYEAPWSPNYSTAGAPSEPLDLTAAISYTGVSTPVGVAIDKSGNAYVSSSNGTVSEMAPNGIVTGPSAYLGSSISNIVIDSSGNIWTPSQTADSVYELSSALSLTSTDTVMKGGSTLSTGPHQVTADQAGNIYIADAGHGLIWVVSSKGKVSNYNDAASGSGSDTCTAGVTDVAFDPTGSQYVWSVGNGGTDNICRLVSGEPGTVLAQLPSAPSYVAIDSSGDGWATASGTNGLYEVTLENDVNGPYNGGGLEDPTFLTVDGGGNIWIVNNASSASSVMGTKAPSLSEFDNTGDPLSPVGSKNISGYQYDQLSTPSGIAIDQSGDVWVTNQTGTSNGTVTEVIGAATPTKAPLVTGPGGKP